MRSGVSDLSLTESGTPGPSPDSKGETNNAISEVLSISPHTVKSHVIHIFNKLGVSDRTQASVLAIRHLLI